MVDVGFLTLRRNLTRWTVQFYVLLADRLKLSFPRTLVKQDKVFFIVIVS